MNPESTPSPGGKGQRQNRGFSTENRSEDLEKDLWDLDDLDDASPGSEEAPEDAGEENDALPTSIPVSPRTTKRDLTFKQTLPKRAASAGEATDKPAESPLSSGSVRPAGSVKEDEVFEDLEAPALPAHARETEGETPASPSPPPLSADPVAVPQPSLLSSAPEALKSLPKIERLGLAFMRMEAKLEEIKAAFGLENEDLNLNLGPLGDLW